MTTAPIHISRIQMAGPPNHPQPPIHKRLVRLFALLMLACLWLICRPAALSAESRLPGEYQVKAAFVFAVTKFVDWPGTPTGTSTPLRIAVLGSDPFGQHLDDLQGKTVRGRPVVIRRLNRVEDAGTTDVLYISPSEKANLQQILKQLRGRPVLTVSDFPGFCRLGGMVNLVMQQNRVAFEVNNGAAQRSRIRISSKLLKLAKIVIN